MPCTQPKRCWVQGTHPKTGKPKYVFKPPEEYKEADTNYVPCGQCISCLIDKSKEWATRGFHESQMHLDNCFITLTYNDDNLPTNGTLVKEDLSKFIRALRDKIRPKRVKFLAAGEYGSEKNSHRPHYHAIIFGWTPGDKEYFFSNEFGDPVYTSETISKLWKRKGFITVSPVNYRTCAYVARYTTKKIVPKEQRRQENYWIDTQTGETNYDPVAYKYNLLMQGKIEEFITMSNGIGKDWYAKYKKDTDKDFVIVNYAKHKIPRYYDKLLEKLDPEELEIKKEKRVERARELVKTDQKLSQEAIIAKNNFKKLNRRL
jgi:hypothetical protein